MEKEQNDAKTRIEQAAITLLTQQGYSNTTTLRIAQLADVNEVTVFRIFGTKKALLHHVYYMLTPGAERVDMSVLSHGKDLAGDLVYLFKSYLVLHIYHMPAYRLSIQMIDEIYDRDVYYGSFSKIESMTAQLTDYLEGLKNAGIILPADYRSLADYMFSLFLIKANELVDVSEEIGYNEDEVNLFVQNYTDLIVRKIQV
ncbi:MAG: TetR/AcrR family transcriptional regulator [Christensenellaceae bacterium]